MVSAKEKCLSSFILISVFLIVASYFICLQFISPTLYEVDGYYHIAVSNFLKNSGPHYQFRWCQFSTFKDFYSDSDFLFHLSIIPFLYLQQNIILAAKYAVIFYNIIFLLAYLLLLRKYLPDFLAACFLLFLPLSSAFSFYFLLLRGMMAANILIILGIYFLIHKRWRSVFLLSVVYSLTHLSFLMLLPFVFICESSRYLFKKEFFLRNIYSVILGILIGCFIHPNFPNNLLSIHLNVFLVPLYSAWKVPLRFGAEVYSSSAKAGFTNNFAIFFTLYVVFWNMFLKRTKVNFATAVWWGCSSLYLALSFFSVRFWYQANILFFIFLASYLNDWLGNRKWQEALPGLRILFIPYAIIAFLFSPSSFSALKRSMEHYLITNKHYEQAASWMRKHIPEQETIFHAGGSDSSYFICLNPKNNYLFACDPIYMFYRYPKEYVHYADLQDGRTDNPAGLLRKVFKVTYGYTRKIASMYQQIISDQHNFQVLYEDDIGIIFKVL